VSHLLDTNSVVDLLRNGPASKVAVRVAAAPAGSVHVCSVVIGELVYGAHHGAPANLAKNLALIADVQLQFVSLPFEDAAADAYGRLRARLAAKGQLIGPNDLLIAAIALATGCTLVTNNTREFKRVPGLTVEDWL
jgi:tRNA(fMet)-specific endonuclease VapC